MDRNDYDNRVLQMLNEGDYACCEKHPLQDMKKDVDEAVKCATEILKKTSLSRAFKVSNPRVPILYALPKTHKAGQKMRPICSNTNAPTSKIAIWVIKKFRNLNPPAGFDIKNSVQLTKLLKNVKLTRNEILVSFDVTALYPSIPVDKAMEYFDRWLNTQELTNDEKLAYTKLTNVCLSQNIFQFRDSFYVQKTGVAMGNPISSFISNLYMCYLEIEMSKHKKFPRIWHRYVDDVFCVISRRQVAPTLNFINSQNESIKFTCEEETNCELPFLDLLIKRNDDGTLHFQIYRKPTATDRFITANSNHSNQHKKAAFNSMIHRLLNIPLSEESYLEELTTIYNIADKNGYGTPWVDQILNKMKNKQRLKLKTTHIPEVATKQNRCSITYVKGLSEKLTNIFKKHKIQVASKSSTKLTSLKSSTKDQMDINERSGIYAINCGTCELKYIGMTRRSISTRYKEHKSAARNNHPEKSAVADHMLSEFHNFDSDGIKMIKECSDNRRLKILEAIFIKTTSDELMNNDEGNFNSPLFKLYTN